MTDSIRKLDFRSKLTHKQTLAWDALCRTDVKEVLYGGAKGGGKSVFGCLWCFEKALDIIKLCDIAPRKHPIPVGFMGRKRGVDFTNTTLETWKRFIPEDMYEIKGKPAEIIVCGRVKILTGGLDNSDLINKFNSAEYAFFFLDQAEEIDAEQIGELRATFRLIINGVKVPGKGLFTANPAPSFLKDEFILNPTPDRLFIQALPTDNHHLGPEFNEAIFEGVITALYQGQLFEKLRLAEKRITSRDVLESTTRDTDSDTQTDMEGTADDKTVVVDDQFSGTVDKDDDSDVLVYRFSKDFPEIKKHAEAYEAEITKLIANIDIDTETVLVEYRDI